jgi:hypothetical protein
MTTTSCDNPASIRSGLSQRLQEASGAVIEHTRTEARYLAFSIRAALASVRAHRQTRDLSRLRQAGWVIVVARDYYREGVPSEFARV